jgi:hypothetical protein
MLRRLLTSLVVGLLLVAGALVAPPQASALLVASATTAERSSARFDNSIGRITVPDQALRPGCRRYLVRWRFTPPRNDEWTVISDIRGPRGKSVHSLFWDSNSPNKLGQERGRTRFTLCRYSVRPGRYSVHMQMQYTPVGGRDPLTKRRQPVYFRFLRR